MIGANPAALGVCKYTCECIIISLCSQREHVGARQVIYYSVRHNLLLVRDAQREIAASTRCEKSNAELYLHHKRKENWCASGGGSCDARDG
jgi:hypothetical protein